MYYPYLTIGNNLECVHTPIQADGSINVHFEKPNKEYGFKTLEISLPSCSIIDNYGFKDNEVKDLLVFCKNNKELIFEFAEAGGIKNA